MSLISNVLVSFAFMVFASTSAVNAADENKNPEVVIEQIQPEAGSEEEALQLKIPAEENTQ